MAKITLDEIIEAFISHGNVDLKMEDIKKYVLDKRGNSWQGYKDKRSFNETIMRIVENHCLTRKGNKGVSVFINVSSVKLIL